MDYIVRDTALFVDVNYIFFIATFEKFSSGNFDAPETLGAPTT